MSKAIDLVPALLRRLLRAKVRIDVASQKAGTIDRPASISGVSQAHFARLFKAPFGVPLHRYLLSRRIERAHALFRDTELPIIDVALQTGWASLGTFRDITGGSPASVRSVEQGVGERVDTIPPCFASADASFREPSGNGWTLVQAR